MDKEVEEPMTLMFKLDKEAKESVTPRSKMGSTNVNSTPRKIGFTHFVRHKSPWDSWYSQEIEPKRLDQLCKTLIGHRT